MDVDVEVINFQLKANMFKLQYNFRTMEMQAAVSLYPKRMWIDVLIYGNREHLKMIKIRLINIQKIQVLIFDDFALYLSQIKEKRYFLIIPLETFE